MRIRIAATGLLALVISFSKLFASEHEANALSQNVRSRHMPYGTVIDPVFASPESDQITGYSRCGDSAIWTGHYLAGEAFRYAVTRSAAALDNVSAALNGVRSLVDVTGTDLLARCLVPAASPYAGGITQEEAHNGIRVSVVNGTTYYWIGSTSRDQYLGVLWPGSRV